MRLLPFLGLWDSERTRSYWEHNCACGQGNRGVQSRSGPVALGKELVGTGKAHKAGSKSLSCLEPRTHLLRCATFLDTKTDQMI